MTKNRHQPDNLQAMLERMYPEAEKCQQVSVGELLDSAGTRSFGPVVLLAGLIVLAPLIGDIPGVPTLMGLLVLLTLGQQLFHRERIWLPAWLSERQVSADKLRRGLIWMRKPARWLDRYTGPRLTFLVNGGSHHAMAIVCMGVALALPVMEFVPFSANGGGLALMAFGLAMIARDGLLALLALAFTIATVVLIGWQLGGS